MLSGSKRVSKCHVLLVLKNPLFAWMKNQEKQQTNCLNFGQKWSITFIEIAQMVFLKYLWFKKVFFAQNNNKMLLLLLLKMLFNGQVKVG